MRILIEFSEQSGASALEASLAIMPVLLACLLGLELVHAHQVKQLANLALHEAGRVASVTAADHKQVNQAFAQALAPRFASAHHAGHAEGRREATIARYRRHYDLPLWQLKLTELEVWGSKSPEYRTVRLDVIYLHEPLQSWLRQILKHSARWLSASPKGLTANAQQQGLIPLQLSRRVVIHSSNTQHHRPPPIENTPQTPQDVRATLPLGQRRNTSVRILQTETLISTNVSRPKDQLDSIAASASVAKPAGRAFLKQAPGGEELCGVLLCCLP